jgi:hypothetical protein
MLALSTSSTEDCSIGAFLALLQQSRRSCRRSLRPLKPQGQLIEKMFIHREWPWTVGHCCSGKVCMHNHQRPHAKRSRAEPCAVVQCWECGLYFCEDCVVDACCKCGLPICHEHELGLDACYSAHVQHCQQIPQVGQFPDGVRPWCETCPSLIDAGILRRCENCAGRRCLNNKCTSQLVTSSCCQRDLCLSRCAKFMPGGVVCRVDHICPMNSPLPSDLASHSH